MYSFPVGNGHPVFSSELLIVHASLLYKATLQTNAFRTDFLTPQGAHSSFVGTCVARTGPRAEVALLLSQATSYFPPGLCLRPETGAREKISRVFINLTLSFSWSFSFLLLSHLLPLFLFPFLRPTPLISASAFEILPPFFSFPSSSSFLPVRV